MDNEISVLEILKSYDQISDIKQLCDDIFMFTLFDKIFVLFCPEKDSRSDRPLIYLYNDDALDYPHIMLREEVIKQEGPLPVGTYRFVCLYEHESIVNSIIPYEEKIVDSIDRLIELLSLSKTEQEKEFHKEFLFYWNTSSKSKLHTIFINQEGSFSRLEMFASKSEVRLIEQNLTLSDINDRDKDERKWIQHVETEAYYIPITDAREILPPHRGFEWSVDTVKEVIYGRQIDHIGSASLGRLKQQQSSAQSIILVFGMKADGVPVCYAVKLTCKSSGAKSLFDKICDDAFAVECLYTKRKDYLYLSEMIGNDIGLLEKKVLIIGCGSLGSYITWELAKNGAKTIKVYDGETLVDENTLRWAYSGLGVGVNKASHIEMMLHFLHPQVQVLSDVKNIDEKSLKEELSIADMIICTIGSSDTQLRLNRILMESGCKVPVFFAWLEAGGQYSHILSVDYSRPGCFECLYTDDNGNLVNNRANKNTEDQAAQGIIRNGCGGTRAAYGTAILLRTTAALLETIKRSNSMIKERNYLIDISPEAVTESDAVFPIGACNCCGDKHT